MDCLKKLGEFLDKANDYYYSTHMLFLDPWRIIFCHQESFWAAVFNNNAPTYQLALQKQLQPGIKIRITTRNIFYASHFSRIQMKVLSIFLITSGIHEEPKVLKYCFIIFFFLNPIFFANPGEMVWLLHRVVCW